MMKKLTLFIINCSLLIAPVAHAAVDNRLVARAESYLNGITGLAGEFTQSSNGKNDRGTFSMLRPGRIRLDYSTLPIQLISNGKDLYFYDKSLDQITTVPLTSTPAGILIRKNINLANADITVSETNFDKAANTFSLKMHIRGNEGVGQMVVNFSDDPMTLRSWTVIDATGSEVDVVFRGMKTKTDFPKNFFQLQKMRTTANSGGDAFYE
ncbi:MAG: outer membrane lipoprotein carrier protein LolA [Rickettsiales bacterium]|jgi:outer membrane lipoprotein-sorting protein|nr:outer membrane lipoprotein carrier protein LolA [Rickettsiales bacterium]